MIHENAWKPMLLLLKRSRSNALLHISDNIYILHINVLVRYDRGKE